MEKLNIKTRKPYTITKQRERWTEDEHSSFLEALKLYGRAWQRIEEHIGTKTAVQIRSHAQKFFTKLEKEAVAKGVPIGQALNMEIPPPRPKRKPNYPYPRKTHTQEAEKLATSVSSLQLPDVERKPFPEKTSHTENLENEKTCVPAQYGIEGPQEAPCASLSLENENSITIETKKQDAIKQTNINISLVESSHPAHENIIQGRYSDNPVDFINDTQGKQIYPRHVPVQVVDVHQGVGAKTSDPLEMSFYESKVNNLGEVHEHRNLPNLFVNTAAASATSGQNHNNASKSSTIPTFHPLFAPNLFVNIEDSSADSFSRVQLNPETMGMAAIAAATVAAATAWWSAHGLFPVCTPFYPGGYSCTFQTPIEENQVRVANTGREKAPSKGVLQEEKMYVEKTESAADLSSSYSYEPKKKLNIKETVSVVELHDSSKTNVGKQIDRSSCDSNITSSSETEMDVLEKHEKETEETKGSDVEESISRRGRSTISPNGSWKGVSDEASNSSLCHIFSDNRTVAEKDEQNKNKNRELDLNRMSQEAVVVLRGEEGVLRMGLGSVKVNVHHTGFRPYKRCSIEAKESSKIASAAASTGNQNDQKGPKRMCLGQMLQLD
ncbi:hypothetical protein L1987_46867 [Smallanthus sonchifolius]|uniref:Uncharacterized protein n=1 Tax=Smallanthus sonchifolius TaxID=185202 RepID=A0ACB9G1K4_9ASTR|nr:hypothetical protein L1987_46867 [Smallanthus sonchifolius]